MKKLILVFAIVLSVFGCSKSEDSKPVIPPVVVVPPPVVAIPIPNEFLGSWKQNYSSKITLYIGKAIIYPQNGNYYTQKDFKIATHYTLKETRFLNVTNEMTIKPFSYSQFNGFGAGIVEINYDGKYFNYSANGSSKSELGATKWNEWVNGNYINNDRKLVKKDTILNIFPDKAFKNSLDIFSTVFLDIKQK